MSPPIPQDYIDELLARTDLVELIGSRVELRRSGHEYLGRCPFHDERTPSFTVSPQKGFYHCFGCGAHGSALGFLMAYERLDFPEAVRRLAEMTGFPPPPDRGEPRRPQQPLYEILEEAASLYRRALLTSPLAQAYLDRRSIHQDTVARYALGYAPAQGALATLYKDRPKRLDLLEQAGLIRRRRGEVVEVFRHRLLFPIRDTRGRTLGFGGRALEPDQEPKYLNSPEGPLFHKGRLLYGQYEARIARPEPTRPLLVVEGYMDVLALAQGGLDPVVACLGTALTETQTETLFRMATRVVFCFDGDAAGRRAAGRTLARLLPLYRPEWEPRYLELPEGEDPDTLLASEGRESFEHRLTTAQPLSAFLFLHLERHHGPLDTIEARTRYAAEARRLIDSVQDPVFRDLLSQELARRLGLSNVSPTPPTLRSRAVRARTGRRPPPPDVMRRLIHLLLHHPSLSQELPCLEELKSWPFKGTSLLGLFRRLASESEEPVSSRELLDRFAPGSRERRFLESLLAQECILEAEAARLEVRAAIDLLRSRHAQDLRSGTPDDGHRRT